MDDVVTLPRREESPGELLQPRFRPQKHLLNEEIEVGKGASQEQHATTSAISTAKERNFVMEDLVGERDGRCAVPRLALSVAVEICEIS